MDHLRNEVADLTAGAQSVKAGMDRIPPAALWLGILGTLPFWFGAADFLVGVVLSPSQALAVTLAYGAVALAFLGGIRWGIALGPIGERWRARTLMMSVAAPFIGFLAFFLAPAVGLALLLGGLLVQALWDVLSADHGFVPPWFGRLRAILTVLAVLPILLMLAALMAGF